MDGKSTRMELQLSKITKLKDGHERPWFSNQTLEATQYKSSTLLGPALYIHAGKGA